MKKLEVQQLARIQGGSRCELVDMAIGGIGVGIMLGGLTPIGIAVGIVAIGVSIGGATGCSWK